MKHNTTTTYSMAIIQSRAHRTLKSFIAKALHEYGLTMMQWSIIGEVAASEKEGVRISDLANDLDTSLAFITTSVNVLEARGILKRSAHDQDNRAKVVSLTDQFAPKVNTIETELNKKLHKQLIDSINPLEFHTYMRVLESIAKSA